MSDRGRLAVIGGGVIGASCAYHAARSGWNVTIIERGTFGGGCSHGNCGYVCPSHVLPLARPGAIGQTLRMVLRPNAPLRVAPRFDPALWSWFLRFARRCNKRDMLESARALEPMLLASRSLYAELMQGTLEGCEWEERGLLFVFGSKRGFEVYAAVDRLLRDEFGMGATAHEGDALLSLEPSLTSNAVCAWHYETDAHLRPDKLMAAYRKCLGSLGTTIYERCAFESFSMAGSGVTSLKTTAGEIPADAVIVATGAWTPTLHRQLGIRLPIQPGKGYSITMAPPARMPRIPMIFEEEHVAVTPMRSGYRIGSTMEFAGYDETIHPRRISLLTDAAKRYLHASTFEPLVEKWFGWRPMVYDGKPIIGPIPHLDNVLVATGHGMLGLSLAPSTGKLVAELLNDEAPHLDPMPFRVERF